MSGVPKMLALLGARRFAPLFVTQALGAVNDNLFKNALVVLALYKLAHAGPVVVAAAGGVFILPYALFSALAGQVADKFDKARLIKLTKFWELGLMGLAAAGFLAGNIWFLLVVLFGLGMQAAFFSPLKYGILPDHLPAGELAGGNGLIEAGTFVGILAGTLAGAALILLPHGPLVVALAGLGVALAGLLAARFIPAAPPVAMADVAGLRLRWNVARESWVLIKAVRDMPPVWLAVLAISWFWAMGASVLAVLPAVVRDDLHGSGHVVSLLLLCFSVGIGAGSLLSGALAGRVARKFLVPLAGLVISGFMLDFAAGAAAMGQHLGAHVGVPLGVPFGVAAMFSGAANVRMLVDLVGLAVGGGLFSVPLYVICQERAPVSHRARVIAANNILNAGAMVLAAVVTGLLFARLPAGPEVAPLILALTAVGNVVVTVWVVGVSKKLHDLP